MEIRPFAETDIGDVVDLSLRAWEPVFDSLEEAMDADVYAHFYPDWRVTQAEAVRNACTDDDVHVWVALAREGPEEEAVAGFVALKLHGEDRMGEIYMIAVDPEHQRRGIARNLTSHSMQWFEDQGMAVVMVETGGDPGHAPARRAYESAGFRRLEVARYFRKV
ncbi:MAG: GNAT family N-acetyltransferase [Longimicrobiales bacterium]|nr:GNAT family N-acetyltransferase [Longimicrobiales bacterium]